MSREGADATRITLIQRLADGDAAAWDEAESLYRPLISKWLRRHNLQSGDVDDLTQEVMVVLVRDGTQFDHNGRVGAFRKWLRLTTVNVARNYLRRHGPLHGAGGTQFLNALNLLEDESSEISRIFDREHNHLVLNQLLDAVAGQVETITLTIFRRHVLDEVSSEQTAAELGVSVASVHTAKSRVLRRLRTLAADWIDDLSLTPHGNEA